MSKLETLKTNIREKQYPYFEDEELETILDSFDGDVRKSSYHCLILKSENTGISVPGMTTQDTSNYFKRLASMYVSTNSGTLR